MTWDTVRQDLLYTTRTLRRDAGLFAAAVLIIGLGIGANTTIFSVVNALLFRPLPFANSDRLAWIANTGDGGLSGATTRVSNYLDWRRLNKSFEDIAAYFAFFDYGTYNLIGAGEPERLVGVGVSENFLPLLGVQPMLGRGFSAEECRWNGPRAVLLTHAFWQRRFGGDRGVIGRSLTLNDRASAVVGVLPPSFDFSTVFTPGSRIDMVVPFPTTPETDRWGNTLAVVGRLRPGVTVQQAQAEFDVLNQQIRKAHPERYTFGARLTGLQEHLTARFRRGLLVLLCAVAAVLLIGCTNLSNLLLARAASRRKEIAIRSALGASRARLIGQMLTESFVLSACGSALGLALAFLAIRMVRNIQSVSIPLLRTAEIDGTALLFAVAAATVTGLLFGIVPALQTSGTKDFDTLKDAGRGTSEGRHTAWTRRTLVVSEVALACVLLVSAGLLIRSFLHVLDVDLGFHPEQAAVWRIEAGPKYERAVDKVAFFDRLVRSVAGVPGVITAGITDALPLSRDRSWGIGAKGVQYPPDQYPNAHPRIIDHRYLKAMGIPLIDGRGFSEQDTPTSEKVIVISEKAARELWPGRNAIGQFVRFDGERRVIGVVGNVRHQSVEQEGGMEAYLPVTQTTDWGSVELVVRARLDPVTLAPAIRRVLQSIEPTLPASEFTMLGDLVDRAVSPRRFLMLLLGGFALAALVLASVGIYGVISYSVNQRTQEIGIRMALGASAAVVQRQVLKQTLGLVSFGVLLGIAAAFVLARLTASLLFGLQPTDPMTFGAAVAVLLAVALMAGYIPAVRASRVDPGSALRTG